MAEDTQDQSQKTEEPTSRRLQEAREKGQVVTSREVTSFLLFLICVLLVFFGAVPFCKRVGEELGTYIVQPHSMQFSITGASLVFHAAITNLLTFTIIPLSVFAVAILISHVIQHSGLVFSFERIRPDWSKISITKGLKRLFSLKSIVEFTKSLIKLTLVGIAVYMSISSEMQAIKTIYASELMGAVHLLLLVTVKMFITVCVVIGVIAALDYLYQRYEYMQNLRMSKQDVKDEHKRAEGDPLIKAKIKKLGMQRTKNLIMSTVPKADVVITNPTHYAVALEYIPDKMQAPRVTAKGQNHLALIIKEIALNNFIPIVENQLLARALYEEVEIEQIIPRHHYKAVADVISYIMRIRPNKKFSSIIHKVRRSKQ